MAAALVCPGGLWGLHRTFPACATASAFLPSLKKPAATVRHRRLGGAGATQALRARVLLAAATGARDAIMAGAACWEKRWRWQYSERWTRDARVWRSGGCAACCWHSRVSRTELRARLLLWHRENKQAAETIGQAPAVA